MNTSETDPTGSSPHSPDPTGQSAPPRARAPRDWRFWVGGTGRILMVIGVLMFGFVGYQLWGTGIEYRQHQDELADEFTALQAAFADSPGASTTVSTTPTTTSAPGTTASEPSSPPSTAAPATPAPPTTTSGTAPASTVASTSVPDTSVPDTSVPDTSVPDTSVPGGATSWPAIRRGQVLSLIEIPRINKRVFAVNGVRASDLKRGLGHFPNTPFPGEFGNAAFAGHRTTFGAPLFNIDRLTPGDEIIVTTITNQRFVYIVDTAPKVVRPSDLNVIVTTDTGIARITLTSCHPRWSSEQRIVVSAVLDPAQSAPAQFPRPKPGSGGTPVDAEGDTDTAEDPFVTENPTGDSIDPDEDTVVDGSSADTLPSSAGIDDDLDDYQIDADSFSRGWFDDSAAWWHIAGWGALDSSVVVAGCLLARRTRRWWLGTIVAAVPFVVVLYFVYQNVNRLLPPAL